MKSTTLIAVISPAQCRAARALLAWTQAELAERASLSRKTVADFEQENRDVHVRTRHDIATTLERAGVEFLPGGVRLAAVAKPIVEAEATEVPVAPTMQKAANYTDAVRG
jgi:DNA-binding XRE family transcriptional regulator